jgi:hypothetical protein
MSSQVIMGPILGFRGAEDGKWQTSALIVTQGDNDEPELKFGADENKAKVIPLRSLLNRHVWRFEWTVKQSEKEQPVDYSVNGGPKFQYVVPEKNKPLRIAYGSCFGFSSLKYMNKVEDKNAMWTILKAKQEDSSEKKKPYHLMMMGGDQVYADSMWETVQVMKEWSDRSNKKRFKELFTSAMEEAVEKFYFDLYCQRWTQEVPAAVMRQIPSIMMWDDHDIFDGWGSYPPDQHNSAIYQGIYKHAREHFRLFQLQAKDDTDLGKATLFGETGFTYGYKVGDIAILALDMRSERTQDQVMSRQTWDRVYEWLSNTFTTSTPQKPKKVPSPEHLFVMSSIPVVYVNTNMLESAFGWFPGQQDLEDDFKDQWLSRTHQEERIRLIHRLLKFSKETLCRVTVVSGDVHVAALGYIQSERDPQLDEANVINQFISSAMVHPPPPPIVLYLMEKVMGDKVEEVDRGISAQMLKFPGSSKRFLGARNWLSLILDDQSRVWGEWYVEGEKTPYTKVVHPVGALSS